MLRIIILLIIIACVSLGIAWIADEPGKVVIDWSYYHIETSVLILMAAMAFLALLCLLFYSLLHLVFHTPHSWKKSRMAKRQLLGLESLTETFAALAVQDLSIAHKKLERAQKYLPDQPITMMLAAQLARMEGNEGNAKLYIEKMLGHETTEFIALRNLIENAKNSNDIKTAIDYCKKALALKPNDNWLIATASELYARSGQTNEAYGLLESSYKKRYINRKFFHRETAYLLYENAKLLSERHHYDSAIAQLEQSLRKVPDFTPSHVLLADIYIEKDDIRKAIKIISNAWKIKPEKTLRESLVKALQKSDSKQKYISSVEKIATIHPDHEESRLLLKDIDKCNGL